jgi:hypothetical protein
MSLQLLAKQMEAKGRKGDSMLVHMTPGEVAGLQKLAESAGGSLSVNPETGLVEANFLKRMLPTLVGIGVGAFAGPVAGAAAGAAVGGYQAKRNDQDVGMGMLMGGLGGYGGGTMGAGLTAAGAGAGAAGATAAPMTASQSLSQAGQGLTAIGTDAAKRAAFAKSVGMSGLGMAAAPMMAPGKAPGEIPTDDEMIVYDYDVGRTGADTSPMNTSAELTHFQPTYSNRRKVLAGDYFNAAEGGEVADAAPADDGVAGGMSGASKAAFEYLMGKTASSAPAGGIANLAARATPGVGADNMYAFDPVTGTFLRNPNVPGAATSGSRVGTSFAGIGGGSDYTDPNPGWTNMSDAEKAAYYAENPTMGAITRAGQTVFGYVSPVFAAAQEYMDPGFAQRQSDIASGSGYFGAQSGGSRGESWENAPADMGITAAPSAGSGYFSDNREEMGGGGGGYDSLSSESVSQSLSDAGYSDTGGYSDSPADTSDFARGGLMGLAKGGMKSGGFVVPADVVSMVGEGNTDAGYSRIKSMIPGATAIKGKDGGQADTVKTSIEGKQPARVAHGEMYIPPETVKRMGGAKKLYAMMDRVREQATGSKKQIKPVSLKRAMA